MKAALVSVAGALLAASLSGGAAAQIELDSGGVKVDPSAPAPSEYERTIEERNRERREKARKTGESHVDTTFGPFSPEPGVAERPAAAPPATTGAAAGERVKPEPPPQAGTPATAGPTGDVPRPVGAARTRPRGRSSYETLDEVSGGQLNELIGELLKVLDKAPETVRLRAARPAAPEPRGAAGTAGSESPADGPSLPRVEPGRALYARVLYAVDSDYPGPVMLEILEPPLAGAVATGSFERVRQRLVLRIDRLSWRGAEAAARGWAVGLDCACFAIEGDVDRHWFERLILPAAFRFAEAFLVAKSQPARRVEVSGETVIEERAEPTDREAVYAGLGNAARSAGEILLQDAPTAPTVRIPRDAELAVVFARPPEPGVERGGARAPALRGPPAAGTARIRATSPAPAASVAGGRREGGGNARR